MVCTVVGNSGTDTVCNKWIETLFTYDSNTGDITVDLESDGIVDLTYNLPVSLRNSVHDIRIDSYGWWTGHVHKLDYIYIGTGAVSATSTPTPTPTFSNVITATSTDTPTATLTLTPSPTGTFYTETPTITSTPTQSLSNGLGIVLAPVPVKKGENVYLFPDTPISGSKWEISNVLGVSVGSLSFNGPTNNFWNTGDVAPGLYFVRLTLAYTDGRAVTSRKKIVVAP
jgi:hypothetical protein